MNDYSKYFYVASCIFTNGFPKTSEVIQEYIAKRYDMPIIRCCVPNFRVKELAEMVPEAHRANWEKLPVYEEFGPDSTMIYLCHNCLSIFQEQKPEIKAKSLWELILEDESFVYPDYKGVKMTVQDCWRSYDNITEQNVVRELLKKLNIEIVEQEENFEKTDFCGYSLYQPSPPRNLKLAPKRYVENAVGKFIPHTEEEKKELMGKYCERFTTDKVVAYCHYCYDGLRLGGTDAQHLACLLFPE